MAAGFVIMILGYMIGLIVVFLGIIGLFLGLAVKMRAADHRPDGMFFNGFGNGRNQSEVSKHDQHSQGERPADIWDRMKQTQE